MTQNKNDPINSILQHCRINHNNCCAVFPTSRFPYLTMYTRQCKWKVATTYLIKIFLNMKVSCCLSLPKLQEATSTIAITEKK